mgnify:CR=1 FL=1
MIVLLGHWTLCCASFGIGIYFGAYRATWKETRRTVREEMQYEQTRV